MKLGEYGKRKSRAVSASEVSIGLRNMCVWSN